MGQGRVFDLPTTMRGPLVPKTRTPRILSVVTAAAVTIGTLAAAADVLSQFQMTEDEANETTFAALWTGAPPDLSSAAGISRRLSPEARATAVTAAAAETDPAEQLAADEHVRLPIVADADEQLTAAGDPGLRETDAAFAGRRGELGEPLVLR